MSYIRPEIMVIASAIRQAFESDANPGNTVQTSSNPAQTHLNGFFALDKAAANVWDRLKNHLDAVATQAEAEAKKIVAAAEAEAKKLLGETPLVIPPATATGLFVNGVAVAEVGMMAPAPAVEALVPAVQAAEAAAPTPVVGAAGLV